jgi:hypothetical protein
MQDFVRERALRILTRHQRWRRDNRGRYEMVDPAMVGWAVDVAISAFQNSGAKTTYTYDLRQVLCLPHLQCKGIMRKVTIKRACEILAYHQEWRAGKKKKQIEPALIGWALDIAINLLRDERIGGKDV